MKRFVTLVVLSILAVALGAACDEADAPDARVPAPTLIDASPPDARPPDAAPATPDAM
jgi:hypothetical protein